jgi:Tol biopolymer transport system component
MAVPPSPFTAWSPDGKKIAVGHGVATGPKPIWIIDANAQGTTEPLEALPTVDFPFLVNSWSPDGTQLVGLTAEAPGGHGIAIYSFATKKYKILSTVGEWPIWMPDSRRILYVANKNAFFILDSRTKKVRKIWTSDREVIGPPRITRDGRMAFFTRRVTQGDIWLLTLK